MMRRGGSLIGGLTVGLGLALGWAAVAHSRQAASDEHADDRAAVRQAMDTFAKTFRKRDAHGLASLWTAGGEFRNVDGMTIRGRETLEHAFERLFAKAPEVAAEVKPEPVRFLSKDVAIEEGNVTVRRGSIGAATRAHYRAMFVREGGHWLLAELHESAADSASVQDLDWLVGQWKTQGGAGPEATSTYSWSANKKFLNVQFDAKGKELSLAGHQTIGVDPATGKLHTWSFENDGGVGDADWERDGDHWVVEVHGTLADGRTLSETNVIRRLGDDAFTWQSIDRELDGKPLPDLAPMKIVRVEPAK